ncbi:hypothetical protein ZYGM_002243 [Zygosaccharomyces mellis]|uniref:BolA-like protein 2 n=1 Tax=Zygosaccharomyces mellis TaxID=42258 RepID=A0A4C2EE37_9SACH|nr:hypothetical protein ZYGM_002243 [Zygosaccharomyces mellis]
MKFHLSDPYMLVQYKEINRSSMVTKDQIETRIKDNVSDLYQTIVTDISGGCGQSFDIVIVSNSFQGKNKLQRSRWMNTVLKEEIEQIHAFSCKCYTETEWSKIVA